MRPAAATATARDYDRAHGAEAAADDPFALHLDDNPGLRALYLDAEADDGYLRDRERLRRRHHHRGRHGACWCATPRARR